MRISDLLSKPPPMLVGSQIVMNSVSVGRAIVVDAAVQHAVAAPLHESVRAAAERSSQQGEKRPRETGVPQTLYGLDVGGGNSRQKRQRQETSIPRGVDRVQRADLGAAIVPR